MVVDLQDEREVPEIERAEVVLAARINFVAEVQDVAMRAAALTFLAEPVHARREQDRGVGEGVSKVCFNSRPACRVHDVLFCPPFMLPRAKIISVLYAQALETPRLPLDNREKITAALQRDGIPAPPTEAVESLERLT